jgi:hypothetical protein
MVDCISNRQGLKNPLEESTMISDNQAVGRGIRARNQAAIRRGGEQGRAAVFQLLLSGCHGPRSFLTGKYRRHERKVLCPPLPVRGFVPLVVLFANAAATLDEADHINEVMAMIIGNQHAMVIVDRG